MGARRGELVTTDESTVATESLSDAIVMEDSKSDGRLADSTDTNESDWCEVFCQSDDLFDQLVTSETGPRRRRWRFTGYARCKCKMSGPRMVDITDLV